MLSALVFSSTVLQQAAPDNRSRIDGWFERKPIGEEAYSRESYFERAV